MPGAGSSTWPQDMSRPSGQLLQSQPLQQGIPMPGTNQGFSGGSSFASVGNQGFGQNNNYFTDNSAYSGRGAVSTPAWPQEFDTPHPPDGRMPRESARRKRRFPIWARVLLSFLAFIMVGSGAAYWYYQANYAAAINNITGQRAIHPTTTALKTGDDANQSSNTNNSNNILTGNRINIMLFGSDNDNKFAGGSVLAQTDIIVTIDPNTKYVGMLSIPRDMQVYDPGYTAPKLDEVFSYGFQRAKLNAPLSEKIATAAGHSMDVIEANYGIHIDHYAWVGLDGFVKVIDTAGGVDVDALHPMVDDNYPDDVNNKTGDKFAFKRLYIAPGPQHMNGAQALEYVRTRHSDLVGDFGRSARQQQVLNQLKIKLATPAIINKTGDLLKDLNGAVQTDLDVNQIIQIANLARQIDTNKIERITLSPPDYSYSGLSRGNFGPKCQAVRDAINKMFKTQNGKCVPQADAGTSGLANISNPTQQPDKNTQNDPQASLAQVGSDDTLSPHSDSFASVHSILDLMLMVVFEEFNAGKV